MLYKPISLGSILYYTFLDNTISLVVLYKGYKVKFPSTINIIVLYILYKILLVYLKGLKG